MSKLKELIARLCPEGVPYKPLGEVCKTLKKDTLKTTDLINNGIYPVINSGKELYGRYNEYNNSAPALTIAARGEYAGWISFFNENFWAGGLCYPYTSKNEKKLLTKFIFYYLKSQEFKIMDTLVSRGSIPALNKVDIDKFMIPVPPIEVQEEIVRILDTFSAHAAELQAELQARKEQYEYYRNLLLTFNPSACGCGTDGEQKINVTVWGGHSYKIAWKTMEEVCIKICSGGTPSTSIKSYYNGNIPWMRTQEVDWKEVFDTEIKITEEAVKNSSAKMIPANCVIIAMYGATAAKCCINKIPLTTNQACCNLQINPQIADYKYVYQYICNEYKNLKAMGEGSQSNINSAKIRNYRIPIPPLELQEKIVAILDRFETLVNDLTHGLPAEIAAVREQYEYYRNKLLTFK